MKHSSSIPFDLQISSLNLPYSGGRGYSRSGYYPDQCAKLSFLYIDDEFKVLCQFKEKTDLTGDDKEGYDWTVGFAGCYLPV